MKEPHFKYLFAGATTLFAGVGFAFKFLLDAKDYPELSMVLLATVMLVIGALSLLAALGLSAFVGKTYQDARKQRDDDSLGWFGKWLVWPVVATISAIFVIFFLLTGWVSFSFSIEHLSDSLGILKRHLEAQIR